MARLYVNYSTESPNKLYCEKHQQSFWQGAGIILLVGSPLGLERHLHSCKKISGNIYIYERDKSTYDSLQRYYLKIKNSYPRVIIRNTDALQHDLSEEPVNNIDFDSCDTMSKILTPSHFKLHSFFTKGVGIISVTFASRNSNKSYLNSMQKLLIPDSNNPRVTQREFYSEYINKNYPQYTCVFVYSYRGVSGIPMFCVTAVKKPFFIN
jgi:hypothetical protein